MGNRKRKGPHQDMVNEIATATVLSSPLWEQTTKTDEHELSWFGRRLAELGVINDMTTSTKPPGFYINYSTVTVIVLLLSSIAGLWWFTWNTAYQSGYQKAEYQAQIEQLQKEAADAKKKAEDALKLQTYNARQTDNKDGHTKKEEGH